ncbi:enoyl-CoA hydratase [Paracoccus methylovorus]|uniref:Enoyl-CoA hydratase n=1 Tax=Paracoccus methylovorus TaxID=2812658 RepID=A0ABX7JL99_9RHOB|nr:enoyl-CoA hydratase [Paracoccus methylovorus]QRZ15022.1 enoyl-CoA hydratase [Paracoccus methylovorus]
MSILRSERIGNVLVLTIDGPQTRNALVPEVYSAGVEALEQARDQADIGAVVLTGAGGCFCSGGNLAGIGERRTKGEDAARAAIERLHDFVHALRDAPMPVIAAVEGWAAGAGFSLALACDMIVAARDARFSMAYVRVGLSPDGGGTASLTRMLPRQMVSEIVMEGGEIGAERLHAFGLVNELADAGTALTAAFTRAERLAKGPRGAIASIKGLVASGQTASFGAQLDAERDAFARNLISDDAGEGLAAFFEKRAPRFGRK